MKRIFLLALFLTLIFQVDAQRNCGAMDHLEQQIKEDPSILKNMDKIERFTQDFLKKNVDKRVNGVVTIPTVVHVVYRTSAENISAAQIQSQIDVLNEDFRRLNSDADGTWSQATDSQIEFCLATIDPNGNATNGITRTQTSVSSHGTNNSVKFDSQGGKDAWPSSDYLNVWVCNIGGGILGYAQFPGGSSATDGVVNDYRYFGTTGTATAPFDLGRTMTHEVGHWLNLRHIWGDGGCSVDDFVSDTPTSDAANYGCALGHVSCSTVDMVQNYMDYSDDACMNLFTVGQKDRMRALFDPGGFRESLLASNGCGQAPDPTCTDGVQNGNETGIDCGGPDCDPCPTCSDGIQNGNETGVDCGGPDCPACPCLGTEVTVSITLDNYPSETSWQITNSGGTVVASGGTYGGEPNGSAVTINNCFDDGCYDFTIFDSYGDGICCAYGSGSYSVTDGNGNVLASGGSFGSSETTNFCLSSAGPTCSDGIQNGQETGVDCGGPDCPACPTCDDGIQNGNETGTDCGGPDCPACPTCDDGIQNGQETGLDCGGPDCPDCPPGPTCTDGIQNGNETGVDCGGPDCDACDPGNCTDVLVAFDDFESSWGIWNDGGSDSRRMSSTIYAYSGIKTVRIRDNTFSSVTTTDVLDLAGFESVTINFTYMARSMENGEDFWLQASVDGGAFQTLTSWVSGTDFQNEVREFESVEITGTFTSNVRFRFRNDASANGDQIYLDDIEIRGCANSARSTKQEPGIIAEVTTPAIPISNVKVYPNPSTDLLNIKYIIDGNSNVDLNVLDMAGRRVMNEKTKAFKGENEYTLSVSNLSAGIYYIQIVTDNHQELKRFVVIE